MLRAVGCRPPAAGCRLPKISMLLRFIALISAVYDISAGVTLLFFRDVLTSWFGVQAAQPPIHADLNAIFVTVVGLGYVGPLIYPERYRAYLWVFGVGLKGAGAIAFVSDFLTRDSPASYLLFAACDGALAVATLLILWAWPVATPLTAAPSSRPGT
jgi:hypothetical protein